MCIYSNLAEKIEDPNITPTVIEMAEKYLREFNYINGKELSEADFNQAINEFQQLAGINIGNFDYTTFRAMQAPRCGVADRLPMVEAATKPPKWGLKHLTWYIEDYIPDFPKEDMEFIIKDICDQTSKIIDLTFEQVKNSNKANFIIRGDNSKRDGLGSPSQTLAYHYLPPTSNFTGQLEGVWDKGDSWRSDMRGPSRGIKFRNVWYHEMIIHGLGLVHSKIESALGAPFYSPSVDKLQSPDDIERLVALYGRAKSQPQPPTPPEPPAPPPADGLTIRFPGAKIDKIEIDGYRIIRI